MVGTAVFAAFLLQLFYGIRLRVPRALIFSIFTWRHSGVLFEEGKEVVFVGKAKFVADVGQG